MCSRSVEAEGEEPALPGLTQFSPQQMLFISYAQVQSETNVDLLH